MNKKKITLAVAILMLVIAFGIMLYPVICTAYNNAHRSEIMTRHKQEMETVPDKQIAEMWERAEAYNQLLYPITKKNDITWMLEKAAEHYSDQLDLIGDGIMGYVQIPKINVYLPIYHGTNETTLEIGVGHLLGSSLPIGGDSTHSILTAHSGMASDRMFSDLPQLREGDVFYLHILDEILAYRVDAIHTVLPHDTSYLGLETDKDLCTLVTCTPFGINTQRLLVRGSRVPYLPATNEETPSQNTEKIIFSNWTQEYLKGIFCGLCIVAVIIACYVCYYIWRKRYDKV